MGPAYLCDMIQMKQYSRRTRLSNQLMLEVPLTKRKTLGDRAFAVSGPSVWNALPLHIRNSISVDVFKKTLNTFLFEFLLRNF